MPPSGAGFGGRERRFASSSVRRTERPFFMTCRAASICSSSGFIGTSARAWPAESSPCYTNCSTSGARESSRSAFATAGRDLPTLCAASSCVRPYSSISVR